jgi:hypothetical protein
MSSPFTYGSVTLLPNGPGAGTDNITALASTNARGLGVLTATPPSATILIPPIKIKSGASAVSGTASLYIITSEDNTTWTDGISPTAASDQSAKIVTATLASIITMAANATTYYFPEFDILATLGLSVMPNYCALVILNKSAAAFDATAGSFSANYLPVAWA